jgi:hypothetical protein
MYLIIIRDEHGKTETGPLSHQAAARLAQAWQHDNSFARVEVVHQNHKSRRMTRVWGPLWTGRNGTPSRNCGDKEHTRIQALLDAANEERRKRWAKFM